MSESKEKGVLDYVAGDLFSTLPLISRSIRKKLFKTAFAGFNEELAPPHLDIIKLLEESGTLHIAEIGERLLIARPQMTHLIDKLVELELVERQIGKEDRRTINIMLTENGKALIEAHDEHIRKATMEALSSLTIGELKELSAALQTLKEMFSKLQ